MRIQIDTQSIAKIQEIMASKKIDHSTLRIFMKEMKCGGPIFGLVMDPMKEDDVVFDCEGIHFVAEKSLHDQYGDFVIEFANGGFAVVPKIVSENKGCASCGSCSS